MTSHIISSAFLALPAADRPPNSISRYRPTRLRPAATSADIFDAKGLVYTYVKRT